MRSSLLRQHAAQIVVPAVALAFVPSPWLRLVASVFLFFALFNLMHDVMHGALGLSRDETDRVLGIVGALIGVSGHATRFFHLRHHARLFAPEDLEGRGVDWSWPRLIAHAPLAYLSLPWLGWRHAPRHWRTAEAIEWLGVAAWLALCAGLAPLRLYAAVLLAAQLTIPIWAARLPHRAPRWMLTVTRALLWTRSPLAVGFALHEEHHASPRLASFELSAMHAHRDRANQARQVAPLGPSAPAFGVR